jgi:monoamine oxidase
MDEIFDYVVVGGGCAGTYVAWRLATAPGKRSIRLCEQDRIGGRLFTLSFSGIGGQIELGGMRYSTKQIFVNHLVPTLGLTGDPFVYPERFSYLRGRRLPPDSSPPYLLRGDEASKKPVQLIQLAISKALAELDFASVDTVPELPQLQAHLKQLSQDQDLITFSKLTMREWKLISMYGMLSSVPLFEIGFWNLLHRYMSSEAYFLAHDGLGYQSVLANWNAAEAITWFLRDFESPKYLAIREGMEELPKRLAFDFTVAGGNTVLAQRLMAIELPGSGHGPITLRFEEVPQDGEDPKRLHIAGSDPEPKEYVVKAHHLILALPKESLKKLTVAGVSETEYKQWSTDLESVRGNSLFKLFLAYKSAWWDQKEADILAPGRAVTDLPIRQVYYYVPGAQQHQRLHGAAPGERLSLLMASYSDARYVDFWRPLLKGRLRQPRYRTEVALSEQDKTALELLGASERMVKKAHRQILDLHMLDGEDASNVQTPCLGLVMDWSQEPAGAGWGWHTWEPCVEPWVVRKRLRQPFKGVHVCGEAFSCEQGWIEGALRSAEMVLQDLGLRPPDWVPPGAYKDANFESYEEYTERGT